MARSDRDPKGRRLPKWRADELFKAIAEQSQAQDRMAEQASEHHSVDVAVRPDEPDPFAGPLWPRWYAQCPEDLLPEEELGPRCVGMLFVCIFVMPFLFVAVGSGLGGLIALFGIPAVFVRFVGRRALPYSAWNLSFWGFYAAVIALLLVLS